MRCWSNPAPANGAWLTDDGYAEAGATIVSRSDALGADVVLMIGKPDEAAVGALRAGQALIGMLTPLTDPDLVGRWPPRA